MAGEPDEAVSASTEVSAKAPSTIRQWAPAVSMTLLGLLSYVDRSVLAILSPTILAALHLSATQYGYAILVFSLCYMLANPIWGFWMDRAGLWVTTLGAVAIWSIASGSHGLMMGFAGMCLARGVLGFGEGATFPAGLKTVTETLPEEKRSFGLGIAYSGSSLGAALTPLLITPVAMRWGWRAAFGVTAVLGLLWIALWVVLANLGLVCGTGDCDHGRPCAERDEGIALEPQPLRRGCRLWAGSCAAGLWTVCRTALSHAGDASEPDFTWPSSLAAACGMGGRLPHLWTACRYQASQR